MDPLTHGLFGAVTAQTGLRQRIGGDATWMATAAAMSPDLDIWAAPFIRLAGGRVDQWTSMAVHRGPTHSLVLLPIYALVIAASWWFIRGWAIRRRHRRLAQDRAAPLAPFRLLYVCVAAALGSHILLDWCTSYGTQIFWPLTDARYAVDSIAIVDLIFAGLLALTLIIGFLVRRWGRLPGWRTRQVAWTGLLLAMAYLGVGRVLHDRAVDRAGALVAATGQRVLRADAYPTLGSIFLWRAVVETDQAWHAVRIHHLAGAGQTPERSCIPKTPANAYVDRAQGLPEAGLFRWFAMGRLRPAYARDDGRHVVELHDMRYAILPAGTESLWHLRVAMDEAGEVQDVRRVQRSLREGRWEIVRQTWADLCRP